VFLHQGQVARHSTAIVRVLRELGGVWSLLGCLLWLVPRPLRDFGYRCIASQRYRIFGKKETCRLPTPGERARFLD
jgi:predicted DCC family thiol-disulfide oxidoreductase YuxK